MEIIFLFVGAIIGIGVVKIYQFTNKGKIKYLRRGIYTNSYSVYKLGLVTGIVEVQFEIGELEKTSDKSKVHVINVSASKTDSNKESLKSIIHNSWIESTKIEWIEDSIEKIREEKLNKILNNGKKS
jgi:hypothetical protein